MTYAKWHATAGRLVRDELKRAGITYVQLAELLAAEGLSETEDSIKGKLKRGSFSAGFLLAVLRALDCKSIQIDKL
jgi:hypothetical protein